MSEFDPTRKQIEYAKDLMHKLGYDDDNIFEMLGKDFNDLTKYEMSQLIDTLKEEWEG